MSNIPQGLKFTEEHEWVSVDGDVVTVGITDYAQDALGDLTYLELPEVGAEFGAGDTFGVVESVKTFSDLYAPVGGTISEVNEALVDTPEALNTDPYGSWLVKITVSDAGEIDALLDAAAYQAHLDEQG